MPIYSKAIINHDKGLCIPLFDSLLEGFVTFTRGEFDCYGYDRLDGVVLSWPIHVGEDEARYRAGKTQPRYPVPAIPYEAWIDVYSYNTRSINCIIVINDFDDTYRHVKDIG